MNKALIDTLLDKQIIGESTLVYGRVMTFEKVGPTFEATNSIKPVIIHKQFNGKFALYTPEGRLQDDVTSAGPFISFEAAKRNAEMNVGMKMNWSDF